MAGSRKTRHAATVYLFLLIFSHTWAASEASSTTSTSKNEKTTGEAGRLIQKAPQTLEPVLGGESNINTNIVSMSKANDVVDVDEFLVNQSGIDNENQSETKEDSEALLTKLVVLNRNATNMTEENGSGNGSSSSRHRSSGSSAQGEISESDSGTTTEVPKTRVPLAPWEYQEKLLLNALMKDYERDIRPVRNASKPVLIEVGITLTQIFDMDEKQQVLTTNVWLDQEWYDELLRWDPEDYGGLTSIRLPCERIWLPDIVLYNNADDYARGYMPSRAMVSHEGKVFWPPPTKFRSTCPVDVTYFPFDDQICTLKLGSWTYNGFQVDVTNRTSEVDLSNYVRNGEWELLEAALQRNVVFYSCCPEPFPDVTITLIIRRKTLYYVYNVVAPCCMLSVLTLLVFCLPPDSGEKVALGITVLLAFSVFMLAIAEKMPETSESIPLIGIYLTAVMAITSISVIVTVVVLNLHYLGPRVHPIPSWLRCLLAKEDRKFIRQKSLLIPANHREPRSGSLKRSHHVLISHQTRPQQSYCAPVHDIRMNVMDNNSGHPLVPGTGNMTTSSCLEDDECSSTESVSNDNNSRGGTRRRHGHHVHHNVNNRTYPVRNNPLGGNLSPATQSRETEGGYGSGGAMALAIQEQLLQSIQFLIKKQEDVEYQNILVAEWRLVAQVVDRILFWIFFVVTLVSSAIFLLILPFYKRSWQGPVP